MAGPPPPWQNEQFIELFDTDLVSVPAECPAWLRAMRDEPDGRSQAAGEGAGGALAAAAAPADF